MGNRAAVALAAICGMSIGVGVVATIYNVAAQSAPSHIYAGVVAAVFGLAGVTSAMFVVR